MNLDSFCLPDLTKTKEQGATNFYFKIKIGYILLCVCCCSLFVWNYKINLNVVLNSK